MWQDGLALLIVGIAMLALLRIYAPVGWFRFGVRRKDDGSAAASAAPTGCSGCGLGASCAKVHHRLGIASSRNLFSDGKTADD